MGPSWLNISNARLTGAPVSWCKIEVTVDSPKHISPLDEPTGKPTPAPPLSVLCLSTKTFMNHSKHANEVMIVSAVLYPNLDVDDPHADAGKEHLRWTAVRKLDALPFPAGFSEAVKGEKMEVCQNERQLLNFFISGF